ncbi:MAG: beta-propeller domain-containing protein [Eggerthellaceae bacterium]|nr:beta-propeller domain-containing protein [Eggerthellaceae bacterium]
MKQTSAAATPRKTNTKALACFALAFGLAITLLVGCNASPSEQKPSNVSNHNTLSETANPDSYDAVFDALETAFDNLGMMNEYGTGDMQVLEGEADAAGFNEAAEGRVEPNVAYDAASSNSYSETNVQVKGIDEGDIVKTDGKNIYMISGPDVVIIQADGADTKEIGRILVDDVSLNKDTDEHTIYPREMYVNNNILLVLYEYSIQEEIAEEDLPNNAAENRDKAFYNPSFYYRSVTEVARWDVSDPQNPVHLNTLGQDGYYRSSRLQGTTLYLVTDYYVYDFSLLTRDTPSTFVPALYAGAEREIIAVKDISILPDYDATGYTVITALDIESGARIDQQSILGSCNTLYMSYENLYLANNLFDQRELNSYKDGSFTITEYEEVYLTRVVKLSIAEGKINFIADALVEGTIVNQFALDEHEGHLRIVTTQDSYRYRVLDDGSSTITDYQSYEYEPSKNALFILDENLERSGSLEGLAEDERVYSVRFDGAAAYFVTFRQVDPLFAADLSDPTNPLLKGELKIPGFSTYLHVYAENRLFGLGMAADEDGRTQGLKISMFDTADPYNISEKHMLDLGWSYSDALYNHKAIIIAPEKGLIGFPVDESYAIYGYSDEEGFFLRQELKPPADNYFFNPRGLYLDDYFYICSQGSIGVYTLDDLTLVVLVGIETTEMVLPIMPLIAEDILPG